MRRTLVATAAAAVLGAAGGLVLPLVPTPAPAADAATAAELLGVYKVKVRGDGWAARAADAKTLPGGLDHESGRIAGNATLVVRARDDQVNDGLVTVEIVLDPVTSTGLLGNATPGKPSFRATAAPVGDTISLVDAGQPTYVNAATLRFDPRGRKVTGTWMAVFPANEADLATQKFATGVTVTVSGRRVVREGRARAR